MFDKLAKGLATLGDDLTTEVVSRRSFLKKTVGVAAGTAAGAATIQNAAASDFCRSGTSANYCPTYCPTVFLDAQTAVAERGSATLFTLLQAPS